LKKNLKCPVCGEDGFNKLEVYYNYEQVWFKCRSCSFIFRMFEDEINYHLFDMPENIDEYLYPKRRKFYIFILHQIMKRFYNVKDIALLDVGSGNCGFLNICKSYGLNKIKGVEAQPHIVRITSKKFSLDVVCDYYKRSLFPEASFDCVYSNHLLEHIKYPFKFISDTYFHLKKNGVLCLEIPSSRSIEFILFNLTKRKTLLKHHLIPQHFSYFNPKSLTVLLKSVGYKEIEIKTGMWFYKRKNLFLRVLSKLLIDPILNFLKLQSMLVFAKKE
jgi:2-polyprenyl-3-methyl-5-hydroxy-6-metoxy-1,4-benzoquinol methylase